MKPTKYPHTEHYHTFSVQTESKLLEWLMQNLQSSSRSRIKATLKGRGILINGKTCTQHDRTLHPGDLIQVSKSKKTGELKSKYLRIVYEDRYIVVVEKSIGILSMAAGHKSLNVKSLLDQYFRENRQNCTAHVVHRLDRDTSGLMLYAKNKQTAMAFEADWHNIVYDRRYVAVLSGVVEQTEGTIANWLKDNNAYFTYSSPEDNGGKYAVSHYQVLERSAYHSLVMFRLETGRKNQIRVHSADMGHPVCGDIKYGNGDDPCNRLCLHAFVLCFRHPITNENFEFETEIPKKFLKLF